MDEFSELYNSLLAVEAPPKDAAVAEGRTPQLSQDVCETIARNLMFFDSDKEKQRRLEMAERLLKRITESSISLSAQLFDSMVQIFTDSQ